MNSIHLLFEGRLRMLGPLLPLQEGLSMRLAHIGSLVSILALQSACSADVGQSSEIAAECRGAESRPDRRYIYA